MAGRRGARSGRGWDALPPRPPRHPPDEHPPGGAVDGEAERGNVPARRRRPSPGGYPAAPGETLWGAPVRGETVRGAPVRGEGVRGVPGRGEIARSVPEQSESERAREICLRQLSARPRTRAELAKALTRGQISAEVIDEVLDRYDEVGIIDDAAFARAWVSSRHHGRGLARRALANELRQRGVDTEVASEALETLDDEAEAATARALVDRKLRSAAGPPEAVFRRLVGMLARKGYPPGVAIRAVKDALAARDAEAAEFADQIDPDALADEAGDPS
ncbi:recombination regulator RecX [Actinoplanes sp. KI2]|uniref:regulatory protein RecX n=1 Tax=Actinoplanes sp. KI2 TaxID=2983315 RepID=UPI0021D5D850|nr:regulatory protein RecX [Actinoplanes sp. KI2]MCU7729995.1 recombination regulator RecX [Actinoplanes sp. KI2]